MKTRTIKEIATAWKAEKQPLVKQSTFAAYMLILEKHILPHFGSCRILNEQAVQSFALQKLNGGMSAQSVKDVLIVLKMVMKFGAKRKWTTHCDWEIKYPDRSTYRNIEVLTIAHHKKILDHIRNNFTFRNLGIYICLSTGLRIGEICGLKWSDIDTDGGTITIQRTIERIYSIEQKSTHLVIGTPKTRHSCRDIPINQELMSMLKPLKSIVNDEYFVLTNEPSPTEPRTYRAYYHKLMEQLEIPHLKFHGLRHSFATWCIESNCDYKTVSEILGHSNISTTLNLYVHPNIEQKKRCIDQMLKSLGK